MARFDDVLVILFDEFEDLFVGCCICVFFIFEGDVVKLCEDCVVI